MTNETVEEEKSETLEQWRDMAIRMIELNQQFADELKQWMALVKERNSDENERLREGLEHIVEIYEHHVKTYDHVPSNVYLMAKIARETLKEKE